jgi:DNA primase
MSNLLSAIDAAKTVEFRDYIQSVYRMDITTDGRILCPFHDDGDPSFSIKKGVNWGKCFSCGRWASLIDFVSQIERISPLDSAKKICDNSKIQYRTGK